jgi:hypothetical protein
MEEFSADKARSRAKSKRIHHCLQRKPVTANFIFNNRGRRGTFIAPEQINANNLFNGDCCPSLDRGEKCSVGFRQPVWTAKE